MKPILIAAAVCTGLAAAAAPVSAQSREQRQMMADLRILQVQAQEMQNMVGALNQAMADALKALTTRLAEQSEATRRSFAEQKSIIDTLSNDLRVVREKIDDNNVRVGSLAQEVDSLRELITAMPRAAAVDPALAGADTGEPGAAPPPPVGTGASPERMWNLAMNDFYSSDYDIAISSFTGYIASFPQSDRADDAQFYIGQSYYNDGKYDKAVEAYSTTIRIYPTSNLLPDAYYKLGESYRNLKQLDRARSAYEYVIKAYPDTAMATQAQQRMQDLR
jgi:tol-pal system protein YbgF